MICLLQPAGNKDDTFSMAKKIEHLEILKRSVNASSARLYHLNVFSLSNFTIKIYCRKLLGDGLHSCSIHELQQIENQLDRSLGKIRARKVPPNCNSPRGLHLNFLYIYIYVYLTFLNSFYDMASCACT